MEEEFSLQEKNIKMKIHDELLMDLQVFAQEFLREHLAMKFSSLIFF